MTTQEIKGGLGFDQEPDDAVSLYLMARVLVVEDDPKLLELYVEVLSGAGYQVLEARDGVEAMQRMEFGPAIVVLDLEMPQANGYEFLEQLRASRDHASVPVIVISGIATGEWALRVGANEFLAKPFEITKLRELVRSYAAP